MAQYIAYAHTGHIEFLQTPERVYKLENFTAYGKTGAEAYKRAEAEVEGTPCPHLYRIDVRKLESV